MGANAQTTVPTFTASQVLTADQMNQSARTGVPVFATTATRDAAFGGTGEKVLAEGQLCYIEASDIVQYYDGSVWATLAPSTGGLAFISSTTIGSAVTSVAVTNVFSSTYDNYLIIVSGGAHSSSGWLNLQMGATTTGYYQGRTETSYAGAADLGGSSNQASFRFVGWGAANGLNLAAQIIAPNLAKNTFVYSSFARNGTTEAAGISNGYLDNTTQYTDFTLLRQTSGTLTGGTIKVYGYIN
jgi:hypothetical protein